MNTSIAPDSGTLHLSAQVARSLCERCVYGCLPKKPNERWWEDEYEGNTKNKCAWYTSVSVFRQKSYKSLEGDEAWKLVVRDIRKNLKKEAKRYSARHNKKTAASNQEETLASVQKACQKKDVSCDQKAGGIMGFFKRHK